MKKYLLTTVAVVLSVSASVAMAAPVAKIGVVNMKQILTSAPQMKAINAKLKLQFSKRKSAILSQAKSLQSDMSSYSKNKAVLSIDKASTMKQKIASEEAQLRTEQMRYQQDLMAAQNKAMGSFLNRLKFSVNKIASKQGLTIVLPKNNLLFASSQTDITSEVLQDLK